MTDATPDWLCREESDRVAPLTHSVIALLRRHRLPRTRSMQVAIGGHVLTGERTYLEGQDMALTMVAMGELDDDALPPDPDRFSVTVGGLDEYVTLEDWVQVWRKWIVPRQEWLWRGRGQRPHGKQGVELKRLREGMFLYRCWHSDPAQSPGDLLEAAARHDQSYEAYDLTRLDRLLDDLYALLRPAGSPGDRRAAEATESRPPE
ncbi:MAG TPA: hypothetical protein VNN74_06695 [Candidatus Micrarchaeia archaeon]|nr:hypothetical protein [Candidatus Micrarchaeia archaeon]